MKSQKSKNYLSALTELEKAISESNFDAFKKASDFIDSSSYIEDQTILKDSYDDAKNPIGSTNLVILASKHGQVKILEYLFGRDGRILNNLLAAIQRTILPNDEDEAHHNAFYYAIRSGNVDLLDTLINKWPNNYFDAHFEELDEILSRAYEELKLKNVALSDEIEIVVEHKLINLRFFSNTSEENPSWRAGLNTTRDRIELILQNINLLKVDYSNTDEVDEKFLFVAKFIAQNIHILKRQFKSTYDRLPWEEIEFCLITFISSYTKRQEINLFYRATLDKGKILIHLGNFAKRLEDEQDIITGANYGKLGDLPQLKREEVVENITLSYPPFEELYQDFQQVRDIHSIEKINVYIKLALSADPKEREGQLIITRVLQVMGEYLKNTLESPNLSNGTSDLLILSLPQNARGIIVDLRNSLSHAASLSKRIEIEENTDLNFFTNVQNDTKKVGVVISNILYKIKRKTIRILLQKIANSEHPAQINETVKLLSTVHLDKEVSSENFKMMEQEKLEKLTKKLDCIITEKTDFEKELFAKIKLILNSEETISHATRTNYILAFTPLQNLSIALSENKTDRNIIIRALKSHAKKTLESFTPKMEHSFKEIGKLLNKIAESAQSRISRDKLDKVNRLLCEVFFITETGMSDVQWIEELREMLNENAPKKQKKTCKVTEEEYNNQLTLKISELKNILTKNSLSDPLDGPNVSFYKGDKKLQAVVEMLVLDIMSILSSSKHRLEDNLLFLDDNAPLLTGKCLRNHLAHDTVLLDVLLSDPSIAVILNAKKLAEKNLMRNKKMIGKLVADDPYKLKAKFDQGLVSITNQAGMFLALEEGDLQSFKDFLQNGADINARNMKSWTTLHFAAKGPSVKIVKFIIDHKVSVDVKNFAGETPLHVAAANGRQNIVEFLVTEAGLPVDEPNKRGRTPLHIAAHNGHKNVVEVLLKNKANMLTQDTAGLSPLHCAIMNNHIDVVKILLEKEVNVDINAALLSAAEFGCVEIVEFLLENGADVHTKTDQNWIPLHSAALNGHLEVVKTLILKGSNVNAKVLNGCTSLHYAVDNGHEEIVKFLVERGANVNAVDKSYLNTPLHYATKNGYDRIVRILLKNGAKANIASFGGITPLHFSAEDNNLEIADVLLKHGANVHATDRNCQTPLFYAAENGQKEVVELLIRNGANINSKSIDKLNPLQIASRKGHIDVVDLLIANKAIVNTQDVGGGTPLHAAALNGYKDIIDLLLKNKAKVGTKADQGNTALHNAAQNGHWDIVDVLIKNEADVNARCTDGLTSLHLAAREGHKDIVNLLINNKAQVNAISSVNSTPLYTAVEAGHKDIVEILIANGANVNVKRKDMNPLILASIFNRRDIAEVLLSNGAHFDAKHSEALFIAVLAGHTDTVEMFLQRKACVNMKDSENNTPLHVAAQKGHKKIVKALIANGADVNAQVSCYNLTPLFKAVLGGHEEMVEILIAAGANVNVKSIENYTPLHMAASSGYANVVKVLLDNKAKLNVKDTKHKTPVECAVGLGHLPAVKVFFQCKKANVNAKGDYNFTLLHIAAEGGYLEIVKYLVDQGADIKARNTPGTKPIHIAAREGHIDIVEFFLSKGLSINEPGAANQTLLHYAVINDNLEILNYLIGRGANVNVQDANGLTPMLIAATFGYTNVIEVLLRNNAIYNDIGAVSGPLTTTNESNLLALTEKLFEAVKRNNCSEVQNCIKAGAIANAKNSENVTPLHYAAWKGSEAVVKVLLENEANPNAVGDKGITPLHYAAKFSHLKIVKALLSKSAVYDAVSDGGKTPSDLTKDESIISLFKLIDESFKNVGDDNAQVIRDLEKIKDTLTIKAIMRARNKDNRTLIVAAMLSNFSKVKELKEISKDLKYVSSQIDLGLACLQQSKFQDGLRVFNIILEVRTEILGPDNPATLEIQIYLAKALYKQGKYQEAIRSLEETLQKQKEILGLDYKDTLRTRNFIGLVLHRQSKDKEALKICQEVHQKQKETLGVDHEDTLDTYFNMAIVLHAVGRFEEALKINREVFEKRKNLFGENHAAVVLTQNNIALVLASQGNYEEALQIYKKVLEKKKVLFGINNSDTVRTSHHIATILDRQKKYREATIAYQEVLSIQKNVLGPNHPETLNTNYDMANMLFDQKKWVSALRAYTECFEQVKAVFGPTNMRTLAIYDRLQQIKMILNLQNSSIPEVLQHLQDDITNAAANGDVPTVQRLLQNGSDVNDKDINGITPLHYAIANKHLGVVKLLLKQGADVTQVSNKGNTPLHTATSQGSNNIVEMLLQNISQDKMVEFINFKTTASGATALHVAAKNGYFDVTRSLLKRGAIYNIKNKEDKTPCDLSKGKKIVKLLKLIEELFEDARNGDMEIVSKLEAVKADEFLVVTNSRNDQGDSLLQVAIRNKRKNIAEKLLELLNKQNQNL